MSDMDNLLELYQSICNYQITECIQELNIPIDIELLKNDMLKFITTNKFGFSTASLRLPAGETDYIDSYETLEATGYGKFDYASINPHPIDNTRPNQDYTVWHPSLEGSYVTTLVPKLEELTGLKIGRIRLAWLQSEAGYPMHIDLEPMRLHIPIVTNEFAYFINDSKLYHMDYGKLYHLITTDVHTAYNFGFVPRLHLIFSTYSNDVIENEISKLGNVAIRKDDFLSHIPKGIDKLTLSYLLKICIDHRTTEPLTDVTYPIQKLRDILEK
jgi:hypothetical protein